MSSSILNEQRTVISDLFKTMQESPALASYSNLAKNWLEECGCFTGFVDGKWRLPTTKNESNVEVVRELTITINWASDEISKVVENSREGFKRWHEHKDKSNVLFRISEYIENHRKLLNAVDSLTKYGRFKQKYNINYLSDSFKYYAGLVGDKEFSKEWKPTGVVCIVCTDNDNLVASLWVLSALLASGNAVLCLVQNCRENLSAFLLAQICASAGLPAGVFNAVPCTFSMLTNSLNVDKIILSFPDPELFLSGVLNKNVPCETIPCLWSSSIIYESADLDAAISNILERMHMFDTEEPWYMTDIYLQESILKQFIKLLTLKVCGSVGCSTKSRPPFYFLGSEITVAQVIDQLSHNNTKDIFTVSTSAIEDEGNQKIPCAIMNFNSTSDQDQSFEFGPGIHIKLFRTVKESIAMFHHIKKIYNVSIWSEDMSLSFEVSSKLKSRTVWINCQDIYEPSVTNGTLYLSGSSNIGGKEGIFSHLQCLKEDENCIKSFDNEEVQSYGSQAPSSSIISIKNNEGKKIEKCVKLYIGGSCVNSNGETFQKVFDANNEPYSYVASADKSDIDKAVSSASSSQPKWESMLKMKRAAVLHKASEILNKRKEEFVLDLSTVTGQTKDACSREVEIVVSILLYWANHISHFDGRIMETKVHGKVLLEYQALGLIGIQCPDKEPLLSFVYFITPAIIFGNAVVAIASEKYPTCAFKMCEVFQAAGLPGGVLNVVSSSRAFLTRHLSTHLNIDAIWFSEDGADFIYSSYHYVQPKKIFDCRNMVKSLHEINMEKFALESAYSKAVFIPMGTGFI